MSEHNYPAFPQHGWTSNPDVLARMAGQGGMTMRQAYKLATIQAILRTTTFPPAQADATSAAYAAGRFADAMLAEDEEHAKK